jgi:hypothetical protein
MEGGIFSFTMNETTDNIGYIFYRTFVLFICLSKGKNLLLKQRE